MLQAYGHHFKYPVSHMQWPWSCQAWLFSVWELCYLWSPDPQIHCITTKCGLVPPNGGPSSTTVKNMTWLQNKVMRSPENIHVKSKATPSEHHSLNLICTPPRRVWAPGKYICQCHNSRSAMLRERWGGRAPSSDLQPSEFAAVSQQPTKAGKKPATEPSNGLLSRAWPGST